MNDNVEVSSEELAELTNVEEEAVVLGTDFAADENPVEEPDSEEPEEAPVKAPSARLRRVRNTTAHVPGPRRKRKFAEAPVVEEVPGDAEEETVAEAPAEAEVSDEGVGPSRFEAPMTLGSVDG